MMHLELLCELLLCYADLITFLVVNDASRTRRALIQSHDVFFRHSHSPIYSIRLYVVSVDAVLPAAFLKRLQILSQQFYDLSPRFLRRKGDVRCDHAMIQSQ